MIYLGLTNERSLLTGPFINNPASDKCMEWTDIGDALDIDR
jgi:hypothetical protein